MNNILTEYVPIQDTDTDVFISIIQEYSSKNVALLTLDEYMLAAFARRGYVRNKKSQSHIKFIHTYGTDKMKEFAIRVKNFGWKNSAILVQYGDDMQNEYINWYRDIALHEKQYIAIHGIKQTRSGKFRSHLANEWFKEHNVNIVIRGAN